MLGRNGNIAYVRYDSQGRIVAGGPIIQAAPPKNGNWQAVSNVLGSNTTGTNGNILRAFIRLDMFGRVVPSSLVIQTKEPLDANSGTGWVELNAVYRGVQQSLACTSGVQQEACTGCPSGGTMYLYTNTTPTNGVAVFLNRNRTIPYDAALFGNYVKITNQNVVYFVADGTNVLTLGTSCPTTTTTSSTSTSTSTTTTISPFAFNFNVGYECDSTQLFITVGPSINGVPPYDIGLYFFNSEAEALANTEWRINAINQWTSLIYPDPRSVNGTYWVVGRDGNGTILAKSVTTTCPL